MKKMECLCNDCDYETCRCQFCKNKHEAINKECIKPGCEEGYKWVNPENKGKDESKTYYV